MLRSKLPSLLVVLGLVSLLTFPAVRQVAGQVEPPADQQDPPAPIDYALNIADALEFAQENAEKFESVSIVTKSAHEHTFQTVYVLDKDFGSVVFHSFVNPQNNRVKRFYINIKDIESFQTVDKIIHVEPIRDEPTTKSGRKPRP